jgi:predicted TIM-barrel fold metal-dependent hydrolase
VVAQLPEQMVDPHIHQWDPFGTPREVSGVAKLLRPLPRIPKWLTRTQPRRDREFVHDATHILKRYLPQDYRRDAGAVPIGSVVHVETASWAVEEPLDSVAETAWVGALPWGRDGAPELGAIVVRTDPRWPRAGDVLDAHLAADDRVRGVRISASHHQDRGVRDFATEPHLLSEPEFLRGFAAIAERGLSFEVWGYPDQLPDALRLATEYPQTTFVLNHYATPVGLFGPRGNSTGRTERDRAEILARCREGIAALAALPNVVAKHSGLGMPIVGGPPRRQLGADSISVLVDRCAPLVRHVHDSFGAQRTMWASNYPMDKPVQSIAASVAVLLEILGDDADRPLLFRDVARRVYRF